MGDNEIPVFVNKKVVGKVIGGTYYKSITGSKHFLKKPTKSIANDVDALVFAQKMGARNIIVTDRETGVRYMTTIALIFRAGFKVNYGYGRQVGLPVTHWNIIPRKVVEDGEPS